MSKILYSLLFLLMMAQTGATRADLVLIVNAETAVHSLSREEVINIYMGRLRQFPSGGTAQPLDLPSGETEKALFYRLLVNKELSDIEAYWARLVFSGRALPPRTVSDPKAMLERVAKESQAIGYIDRTLVDKRVRVIMELQPQGSH